MKFRLKLFLLCLAIPLFVGLIAGLATRNSMESFDLLDKPPLSPPGWLFPVVWTLLYVFMGIASYLVVTSEAKQRDVASSLLFYAIQLAFNFLWSFLFFRFELYWFAFAWLAALWVLILLTALRFANVSRAAAYLMLPYLAWVTFAGYLNLGIAILN
ncbi:MAG: tryptophan-rich sensory protein [Clostridia bacterium]|nr:tryptophan-rich sensory protein [Clostridia bacterium]